MAWTLLGSVGRWDRGATNHRVDVETVQTLLTRAAQAQGVSGFDPKGIDGEIARTPVVSSTVSAIEAVQRLFMTRPDGVVHVGGRTFDRLVEASRAQPAPSPTIGAGAFFPFARLPRTSWKTSPRRFDANRGGGRRAHAGCDLYYPARTPIYAVADGVVLRAPYWFYDVVYALDVDHGDFVARYGEIRPDCPLQAGDRVEEGTRIAEVGKMKAIKQPMLHFELFDKSASGPLTEQSRLRSKKRRADGVPYFRRMDLIDPTPHLDAWKRNLPTAH